MDDITRPAFWRVLSVAYVAGDGRERDPHAQKVLVKVQMPEGDKVFGLWFDSLQVADSFVQALERARGEIDKPSRLHPLLKSASRPGQEN